MSDNGADELAKAIRLRTAIRDAGKPRSGYLLVAIMLAILIAGTAGLFAYHYSGEAPPWLFGAAVVLACCGLFAVLGCVGGFFSFGRNPRQTAFLEGIINGLSDPVVVTDLRGRVVIANDRYYALSSNAAKAERAGVENLYSGYPEVSGRIYRLAQAAKKIKVAKEDIRLNPGSAVPGARLETPSWHSIYAEPVCQGGRHTHTMWRIVDNTDAKIKQETAFEKMQHIIRYLDEAPAGFFSADSSGVVEYINATLADWLGLDLVEAAGGLQRVSQFIPKESAKQLGRVVAKPGETFADIFDLDILVKGGTTIPVRILHSVKFDEDGNPGPSRSLVLKQHYGSRRDATFGSAELKLARFFNNAPIGIAEVDEAGRILNSNTMLVKTVGSFAPNAEFISLIGETSRQAVSDAIGEVRDGKRVAPLEVMFKGRPGKERHFGQVFFNRVEDSETEATSVIIYAIDTTEHKALELRFAQSQKMQAVGQLAGGVAHDFNNMLTAIIGFSDLLLSKHRPTDPSFQDIMNIKQNANRAANLVRQLLAFSRRQTLRPKVLCLTDTLSDLGNLLGRLLGETVELEIIHGRDLGLVKVDVNQFEQVVMNLAVNARDAMPEGGTLTIRTSNISKDESRNVNIKIMSEGEYILCEVIDTGRGMSEEILDKIYEPFFSTKEVGKGTGLGLATVYGIIKQTGGFIFCDSEVDRGSTFTIYLPRHHPTLEETTEEEADERGEIKQADLTGEGTILLVEDEDAVRAFAARALASRGYRVLEADSGVSALDVIDKYGGDRIDLLISDVVMPEMDGPTLLKELRKRQVSPSVIFISGYAEDAFAKNLEEGEKFSFLPKPFSLKQLARAVKEAMQE